MSSLSFSVSPYGGGFGSGLPSMFPTGWGPGVNNGPQWGSGGGGNSFPNIPGFSGFPGGGGSPGGGGFPGGYIIPGMGLYPGFPGGGGGFPGFPGGGGFPGFPGGGGFPGFPGGGFPGFPGGGGFPGFPGGGFPPFPPFPQQNGFNVSTQTVRASMYGFDTNQDGAIDSTEADAAVNRLQNANSPVGKNLSKFYTQLSQSLKNGDSNVDRDGDGKLTFEQPPVFEPLLEDNPLAGLSASNFRPLPPNDELSQLARNDYNPASVSNRDFRRQWNPPPILFNDPNTILDTPVDLPLPIDAAVPPPPPDFLAKLTDLLKPLLQDSGTDQSAVLAQLTQALAQSK